MAAIELTPEIDAELTRVADATGRSKSDLVNDALRNFIEERDDYARAEAAVRKGGPTVTLAEVRRELGLGD